MLYHGRQRGVAAVMPGLRPGPSRRRRRRTPAQTRPILGGAALVSAGFDASAGLATLAAASACWRAASAAASACLRASSARASAFLRAASMDSCGGGGGDVTYRLVDARQRA